MPRELTVGSLFAGILVGGFDLGFERAGIVTRWQVEIDSSCRDVLARHFPGATRYADVREVSGADLEPVDIITFGSPCQDLSIAGQRRGMAGDRSGLYFEALRIIQEMRDATSGRRPALAVWENVEGALSSHQGRDFGAALDALAERGALDITWSVLDSQYFGVAQRRRRVFVVADFGGERAEQILALAESLCGNPAPGRTAWQEIAGPLGQVASSGGGHRLDIDSAGAHIVNAAYQPVSPTLTSRIGERRDGESDTFILQSVNTPRERKQNGIGGDTDPVVYTLTGRDQQGIAHTLTHEGHDASEDGTGRGTPIVAFDWQANPCESMTISDQNTAALRTKRSPAAAFTERTRAGMTVRRLTPTECERLQGFPDGWTATGASGKALSDSVRYRMLGNAVTVTVAAWIGQQIVKTLQLGKEAAA